MNKGSINHDYLSLLIHQLSSSYLEFNLFGINNVGSEIHGFELFGVLSILILVL